MIEAARAAPALIAVGECMVEMAPLEAEGTYRMGFAGDTFNVAWYAARLHGADAGVAYVSAVGEDEVSARMLGFMQASGIDTAHVARLPERTVGLYAITLDAGERSFSYWRSHSAARLLARHLPDPARVTRPGAVVHVSGITLAILAPDDRARLVDWMRAVRRHGATVSFDPNVRLRLWEDVAAIRTWTERVARTADVVLPSLDEEARDFGASDPGEVAERYLAWGAHVVAVKNGGAPGLVATPDGRAPFVPAPAPRVIDTTAAGDSFDAAFLVAMMEGLPPGECAAAGARLAAQVVGARGALVEVT